MWENILRKKIILLKKMRKEIYCSNFQLLSETIGWYDSFIHQFIYQVLCLIGVIANVCIVVVLLRPPMRKNPFNLFLIAIAICDLTLMASYFIYKQVSITEIFY